MRYTPNYNMVIGEGTDAVNPLTQIFPNFETIDTAMENNKNAGITTASEVTTGGVHAIVRVNTSSPVFRFTATSAWTTGDTMTLDGSAVTVHLTDGTAPKSGAYIIGAEVVGIVNGSLVTLLAGASFDGVLSFNSRQGVVTPQSGDYTANMIGYNNTTSGLSAADVQSAVDELASSEAWEDITNDVSFGATGITNADKFIYRKGKEIVVNARCLISLANNITILTGLPAPTQTIKLAYSVGGPMSLFDLDTNGDLILKSAGTSGQQYGGFNLVYIAQ